jgi:hypothetical protein
LETLPEDAFARLMELHTALSPEALTGDGEIPEPVWQARKFELDAALISLQLNMRPRIPLPKRAGSPQGCPKA